MKSNILILGGGFGGLEAATGLRARLDKSYQITLIDASDFFIMGSSKFDLMFGRRAVEDIKAHYSKLNSSGIQFVHDAVTYIDPENKIVKTKSTTFSFDYLVVALGADLHPDAIPGFKEGGYSFYSYAEAQRLAPVIEEFTAGTIIISIFTHPYKCPPAPYEAAFQLHNYFTAKGCRHDITIKTLAPSPIPLPIAKYASAALVELLAQHDIEFHPKHKVTALLPDKKNAVIEGRDNMKYDLFLGIPVHRPPKAVRDSILSQNGWVSVDQNSLRTKFENVYAIGDVNKIPVGKFAVPKAGAFAEDAAKSVVADILNKINRESNIVKFNAIGACYFEVGLGKVAKVDGNILEHSEPHLILSGPSEAYRADKIEFETSRIKRWFG